MGRRERGAKKRSGTALLMTVIVAVLILAFSAGSVFCLDAWSRASSVRAADLQRVAAAITEFLTRQIVIYSARVNEYYRTAEGEKASAKSAALVCWFGREELEARTRYTYEEIRERFGPAALDAVDAALSRTSMKIGSFEISMPYEDLVFDMNDFLIVCRLVVEIRMEEGMQISPLLEGRTKYGKGTGSRSNVTEFWDKTGVAVTIPIKIEGDGKNFWVD